MAALARDVVASSDTSPLASVTSSAPALGRRFRRASINGTVGGSVSGLPSLLRLLGIGEEVSVINFAVRGLIGSTEYWGHLRAYPQLKEPAITIALTGTNILVPGSFVRINPGREGMAVGVVPGLVRPSVSVTRPDTYSVFLGVPGANLIPVLPGLLYFSFIEIARLGPKYQGAEYEPGGSVTVGFAIPFLRIPGVQSSANFTVAIGFFHPALTPFVEWVAPYVRWLHNQTQRLTMWLGDLRPRWCNLADPERQLRLQREERRLESLKTRSSTWLI